MAPCIPSFFGVQYSPSINKLEVIAYLKNGFLRIVMCSGQATFFIFLYIKDEIEIASNNNFLSFEIFKNSYSAASVAYLVIIWPKKESFERISCLEFIFEKSKHREAGLEHKLLTQDF